MSKYFHLPRYVPVFLHVLCILNDMEPRHVMHSITIATVDEAIALNDYTGASWEIITLDMRLQNL